MTGRCGVDKCGHVHTTPRKRELGRTAKLLLTVVKPVYQKLNEAWRGVDMSTLVHTCRVGA